MWTDFLRGHDLAVGYCSLFSFLSHFLDCDQGQHADTDYKKENLCEMYYMIRRYYQIKIK